MEGSVNNTKIRNGFDVIQTPEPLMIFLRQSIPSPPNGLLGLRIETSKILTLRAVGIVVAFNAGHSHAADDIQAFFGTGVVTHDVAQTDKIAALVRTCILKNGLKSFE